MPHALLVCLLAAPATTAAPPDPLVTLTAAAEASRANLDSFPTLTVEHTVRPRAGKTAEEAVAAAPPTSGDTATVRVVRHAGRLRVTVTEDPASEKARDGGPATKGADGRTYSRPFFAGQGDDLAGPSGLAVQYTGRHQTANIGETETAHPRTDLFVLKHVGYCPTLLAVLPPGGFAGSVAAARAGRLTATCETVDGKLAARFADKTGSSCEYLIDPARGHLPVRAWGEYLDPATGKVKHRYLTVLTARECSGGRWFPDRLATVVEQPNRPPGSRLQAKEFRVTKLDADAEPPAEAFRLTLPAGTKVNVTNQPERGFKGPRTLLLAEARTVGPDDLAGLFKEAYDPPPPAGR